MSGVLIQAGITPEDTTEERLVSWCKERGWTGDVEPVDLEYGIWNIDVPYGIWDTLKTEGWLEVEEDEIKLYAEMP